MAIFFGGVTIGGYWLVNRLFAPRTHPLAIICHVTTLRVGKKQEEPLKSFSLGELRLSRVLSAQKNFLQYFAPMSQPMCSLGVCLGSSLKAQK